jgi:hypothetical protein
MSGPACPTGKVRYATATEAHAALVHATKGRRRGVDPFSTRLAPYFCHQCAGHHLGSTTSETRGLAARHASGRR